MLSIILYKIYKNIRYSDKITIILSYLKIWYESSSKFNHYLHISYSSIYFYLSLTFFGISNHLIRKLASVMVMYNFEHV